MRKRLEAVKSILCLIGIIWVVFLVSHLIPISQYGIRPRTASGLIGIITSPFLHSGFSHITMNTLSLVTFGIVYAITEAKSTLTTIFMIILLSGLGTWVIGREANHIGASGLVFGLYGYLIALGWYSRKFVAAIVSIALVVVYGSLIFGVLPGQIGISWEGHLCGLIAGGFLARQRSLKGGR